MHGEEVRNNHANGNTTNEPSNDIWRKIPICFARSSLTVCKARAIVALQYVVYERLCNLRWAAWVKSGTRIQNKLRTRYVGTKEKTQKIEEAHLIENLCLTNAIAEHFVEIKEAFVSIARVGRVFARQFLRFGQTPHRSASSYAQ
jgi:hypothetical protein